MDLGLAAKSRSIHQRVDIPADLARNVDRIARRAGHRAHDGALLAEDGIDERRLARVWPADDGEPDRLDPGWNFFTVVARLVPRLLARPFLQLGTRSDDLHEGSDAAPMCGAHLHRVGESEPRELTGMQRLAFGVQLV